MENSPKARTLEPKRTGQKIILYLEEDSLPLSHPARLFWEVFGTMDLSRFTAANTAVEGHPGRPEVSPRVKLTLWCYAICQGISSAREIERKIASDTGFRWIVGDLSVGHTSLSDFLSQHISSFKKLFVELIGMLLHEEVLSLSLVAQDGTRVIACASKNSFRKELALRSCKEQAELHLKAVLGGDDDPDPTPKRQAARRQAAYTFQARIKQAIAVIGALRLKNRQNKNVEQRQKIPTASTSDPDARLMKMPGGTTAPAYNVQLATAGSIMGGPITIVAVNVSQIGSDKGSLTPMREQIKATTGIVPKVILADADHVTFDDIRDAHGKCELLVPVPERTGGKNGAKDKPIEEWKNRMETPRARYLYRARKAIAERANSNLICRFGLEPLKVKGVVKVKCVMLVGAIVNNIMEHRRTLEDKLGRNLLAA